MPNKLPIPLPTVERLCIVYRQCLDLEGRGVTEVSSSTLAMRLGVSAHAVRRDIGHLGEVGSVGAGYDVVRLREHIEEGLGLGRVWKACVVGLGCLGGALLLHEGFGESGYRLVAGFDANMNRLETIRTDLPLHPVYEMTDIVRREGIEVGLLAVPAQAAQETADMLIEGGIKCILNFAPVVVSAGEAPVAVRNVDFTGELRVLTSLASLTQTSTENQTSNE